MVMTRIYEGTISSPCERLLIGEYANKVLGIGAHAVHLEGCAFQVVQRAVQVGTKERHGADVGMSRIVPSRIDAGSLVQVEGGIDNEHRDTVQSVRNLCGSALPMSRPHESSALVDDSASPVEPSEHVGHLDSKHRNVLRVRVGYEETRDRHNTETRSGAALNPFNSFIH